MDLDYFFFTSIKIEVDVDPSYKYILYNMHNIIYILYNIPYRNK